MTSFTLGTAALATGTAKSTILRAIRAGRISATRDDIGQYVIDPAELARTFPLIAIEGAPPSQPTIDHGAMTDVLVSELRTTIADLRQDRDGWRKAHERGQQALAEALAAHTATQRLLPPPVEQEATPDTSAPEHTATAVEQEAPPKRRWWRRA